MRSEDGAVGQSGSRAVRRGAGLTRISRISRRISRSVVRSQRMRSADTRIAAGLDAGGGRAPMTRVEMADAV